MSFSRRLTGLAAALACAALSACATTQRIDAAGDVRALLIAIRDDDHAVFDAHVDRAALERELQTRILDETQKPGGSDTEAGLGALLAGPLSRFAGDVLLRPKVFLAVADYYGYRPGMQIPPQMEIAFALKSLPDGRVCAVRHKGGACVITFADEGGVWRLVSFDGDLNLLRAK
jgi:hypothetical protein